ncbi:MAG: HupE/UreJ family protein [Betaproteobacteria bacterium]
MHSLALAAVCAPVAALAHAGHGDIAGLGDGVLHVTTGIDHMLAAFAVGLWAMAYPWRRSWILPLAFVVAMLAGAWAGIGHPKFGTGETMIVVSLIILGAMIMRATAFSVYAAAAICLLFGAFHGYAHGTEAGSSGDYNAYLGGLVAATALLHLAGMGVGLMLRIASRYGLRIAGALVAAAGVWFAVGLAT